MTEAPIRPPKALTSTFEAPAPPLRPEAPVPPRRVLEPGLETPTLTSPPRVPFTLPAVPSKPLKRPMASVPIPPPKPSKQEPPPPPPKVNRLNESGDHGKRGLGGRNTFPQPGLRMLPVNEIAQRAAALQQSGSLTTNKRYYKPS